MRATLCTRVQIPALLALAGLQGAVLAQSAPVPAAAAPAAMAAPDKPVFAIRGFDITGDNPLSGSETTRILAPFLRADASMDTLQKATAALEAALKARGFALHRVVLPPQALTDAVKLQIVKFAIGKITIEGLQAYDAANIRASVPELAEGSAPNFRTLAVQTAIANESQGKNVQIALKEAEEADQIDARIVVKEAKPWNFATSLSNTGSRTTGRDRLTFSGSHANVFNRDHQFTGAYTTSIERPSDVRQFGANYRVPLYRLGGVLGASYTHSTVVGDFGALKSTGAGQTLGVNYSHYLAPEGGYRSYITLGLDDKRFDITQIGGVPIPGQQVRRSRPVMVEYTARVETDTSSWGYSTSLSANLVAGGGNNLGAYRSEDARIDTAAFRVLRANANYLATLGGGWVWSARGQLQYSPDALISGEQFGLGGATSIRGTSERPMAGDKGLMAALELTTPPLAPGLRMVGFLEMGWLRNNNPNGINKPAHDQLAGAGLGLRYSLGVVEISADWGRILNGSTLAGAANPTMPKTGDNKFHLNISARF